MLSVGRRSLDVLRFQSPTDVDEWGENSGLIQLPHHRARGASQRARQRPSGRGNARARDMPAIRWSASRSVPGQLSVFGAAAGGEAFGVLRLRSSTVKASTTMLTPTRIAPTRCMPESVTLWRKVIPVIVDDAMEPM